MNENVTPEELKDRARRAAEITKDPVFQLALSMSKEKAVEQWKQGKTVAERESAHANFKALDEVATALRVIYERGEYFARLESRKRPL
jgi:hypothetical protein